ncbi:hypothetical protein EYZ11_006403 [Aspergillus tanneri]|uniref:Rhodopsin domain-containing protein n=1 Tax=Aspergillus tanneri TaxID=1220188 RepID=A0A4V3UP87_9EURO|nr:hypothetical protein EYZ11_006403 [Aspergillus tanneri]
MATDSLGPAVTGELMTVLAWGYAAVIIVGVQHGLGSHTKDVDPSQASAYAITIWLSSIFYLAAQGCIKVSVCLFYTRLGDRFLIRMSQVMMVLLTLQALGCIMTAIFQCHPISKTWESTIPGYCINIDVFYLAITGFSILTDVVTYTLPLPVICRLHVPMKQKVALTFILCMGLL